VVDKDGWSLSAELTEKLDQEEQDRLAHLKSWLAKHMRRVKLPDLLIEVDNRLGFTRNFLTPAQREEPSPEGICALLAAVMAHGCNLGVYTMAQLTSNVTYEQLKRIGDWHLTEESQPSALADLVSAITDLDTSSRWGEGKTAASDGQRFSLPRRVLQQTYSTRFSDFALEFYTFVADNYAPFSSLPVECTDRDAAFVLDGLQAVNLIRKLGGKWFSRCLTLLKWLQRCGIFPSREAALIAAEKWIVARISEGCSGLGAIFPPMLQVLIALRCLGPSLTPVARISQVASWKFLENCKSGPTIQAFVERCAFSGPARKKMDPVLGVGE
jgi:Tn3 transposase DDE domain/Squalene-hopene cyclase N-terminal domain